MCVRRARARRSYVAGSRGGEITAQAGDVVGSGEPMTTQQTSTAESTMSAVRLCCVRRIVSFTDRSLPFSVGGT